ncbi:hypothetical protein AEM51_11535 [Bacteroidetes bacterium UKL13-3]|jgi:hypothetical protein|nr:hypothetical protein AEM51_11535 [Bacteroidetes bacterium UKL13-3]
MNLLDVSTIMADTQSPVTITSVTESLPYLVINNYIAFKVVRISNSYDSTNPIPITLNSDEKGLLIFVQSKGKINLNVMTEFEFIAYLTEADYIDYQNGNDHEFKSDYLLIKETFLSDYINDYKETSSLWGGFSHELITGSPLSRYKKIYPEIVLGEKLKTLDSHSYESSVRAIEQPYAFERFLKLYHLLELQFDFFIIDKIQNLTIPRDSNKIGKILNEYSDKELQRLTDLLEFFCADIVALEKRLEKVALFPTISEEMFIDFGKSKNDIHLTNIDKFRDVVNSGSFSNTNLQTLKVPASKDHSKFIINVTAYWIYRMRCSIAHNKIGEYLLSWNDEAFIVEFGEPILKEVLMQCFKK